MSLYRESAWTAPTDRCPHPERWTSTDPQSTEIQVSELVSAFVRALQPELVVETGTCVGQTAWMIGMALHANGHGRLESFEVDESLVAVAMQRCAGLPVTVNHLSSLEWEPTSPIGFAWFDSLLELRVPEFVKFRPWMSAGAIVGFHDTAPHHGHFGEMVSTLPGVRVISLPTPRGVMFAEVL